MRTRLGGGIVDFYRQQSQGELHQPGSRRRMHPRSPALTGSVTETALARNVLAALEQGSQIHCNMKQYSQVRAALVAAAETLDEQPAPALLARSEIDRLDQIFRP
jgi:hypothetical protein